MAASPIRLQAASLTVFAPDGTADAAARARHAAWLPGRGAADMAIRGTTGEANPVGWRDRARRIKVFAGSGIPQGIRCPGIGDGGPFAFFAQLVERVGDGVLRLSLCRYPEVAGVGLSVTLLRRRRRGSTSRASRMAPGLSDWECEA